MKFRLKMMLCFVWLLALSFGIGSSLLISSAFGNSLAREQEQACESYQMTVQVLQLVNNVSLQQDLSGISGTLKQMMNSSGWAAVQLTQADGVLYRAGNAELFSGSIPQTDDTQSCNLTVFSREDAQYLRVTGTLMANGQPLYLTILTSVTSAFAERSGQQRLYRQIFAVVLLAGSALAYLVSGVLTKPLGEVSAAARKMAKGELSVRLKPRSRDEVGQLARDFNFMAGRLEESISEMQQNMERQEQFMGSFAHELKTPMTSIIGYADLLRSQALSGEDAMEAENYIFSEGKRLEALSLKLLDLLMMKNQALHPVLTDPAQLIRALVEHLQPVYREKGINLQCKCVSGSCMLEPDLIKSLLVNLIDNARKALDNGGNIFVTCDWQDGDCRLRVIDNGRGMPKQALEHLTEAFYRVDKSRSRAQGGAGLGLTLCSRIVALHGGTMRFESRENNGTCVIILLKGGQVV